MISYRLFILPCVLVPLLLLNGCGPKADYAIVPIEGVATYKGSPLPDTMSLDFVVADHRGSTAKIGASGAFQTIHTPEIKGVPVGTARVRVYWDVQGDPPNEYKELFEKYGYASDGFNVEITKPDKNLKVEFP